MDGPMVEAVVPGIEDRMAAYYVQRAAYYERVYHRPHRQPDLRAMEAWLPGVFAGRRVLEVATGTGWWTPHAARDAAFWLATDLNPEPLAIAQAKPAMPACVRYAQADAYALAGVAEHGPFDAAFAGCWWSHVPLQRLPQWLDNLHARLQPGARVVMLDNAYVEADSTPLSHRDAHGNTYQRRTLDDGGVHEVLKNFPTFEQAAGMLGPRARDARWRRWDHYWALDYWLD
ncbi:MAG: class I SAM-dependent methyltransferase [Aquabacterium sp.]